MRNLLFGSSLTVRIFVLLLFVDGAIFAQSADVTGVWEIKLDTQTGETVWTATFEQDDKTLAGEVDAGDSGILPLTGTVDGATIKFDFMVPDLDGDMPIYLAGEIDGPAIAGEEGSFVWYGSGRWTGTRKN